MKIRNLRNILLFFAAGILLLAVTILTDHERRTERFNQRQALKFQEVFLEKQLVIRQRLERFSSRFDTLSPAELFRLAAARGHRPERTGYYVYEDDSLVFWSHNRFIVPQKLDQEPQGQVLRLPNGWYQAEMVSHGNRTWMALDAIKFEYPHRNEYLKDHFAEGYDLPDAVDITMDFSSAGFVVRELETPVLGLLFPAQPRLFIPDFAVLALFFSGIILLMAGVYHGVLLIWPSRPWLRFLTFSLVLLTIRALMLGFGFPVSLYATPLFGPALYATSDIFPSLGDFLLNALVLLVIVASFRFPASRIKGGSFAVTFLAWLIMMGFTWWAASMCVGLIRHSSISFFISNFFSLSAESIAGLSSLVILLSAPVVLALKLSAWIQHSTGRQLLSGWGGAAVVYLIFVLIAGTEDLMLVCWPLVLSAFLFILARGNSVFSFTPVLFLLIAFSGFSAYITNKYSHEKERRARTILAGRLAAENDPIAEYLFIDLYDRIRQDTTFDALILANWKTPQQVEDLLREKYFSGYWEKYELRATLCTASDTLVINPGNIKKGCHQFFDSLLLHHATPVSSGPLYFINMLSGRISYLARFEVARDTLPFHLFLEFHSKFIPEGTGYPELLLDEDEIRQNPDRLNYSFARYHNGFLVLSSGHNGYSTSLPEFALDTTLRFVTESGREHLIHRPSPAETIIISRAAHSAFDDITSFSYYFTVYSLLTLAYFLSWQLREGFRSWFNRFRTRIQLLFIGTIVLSILLFGAGTIYYISKQYRNKNDNIVSEKLRSILIELEGKFGHEPALNQQVDDLLDYYLVRFSNVFFADINLYDLNGTLISSSRPEIFQQGLVSVKMDAEAYQKLHYGKLSEFIHEEEIGRLKYLSAYTPFRNSDGEILAYLNLPYFAKQNELENEIGNFLVALINIYVVLMIISITLAVFISNYVTRPIQLIREKLSQVKLGKPNEPINWKSRDELGNLIREYNRMIQELSDSAEMLARSERESAWREMAKQVAHEIKNPLTPMKLSMQHLLKAWEDEVPDFNERLKRIAATLIEQIDTLSTIATEFSNFAQMPRPEPEEINLYQILNSIADLHRDAAHVKITFSSTIKNAAVFAGREQMLRAFNNLVKNAIQAIPDERQGLVKIKLRADEGEYIVTVEDNGEGIADEVRERIFEPNFTTKTGGMGLGLAMVKNIVEMSAGRISFETKQGEGTTFTVHLPKHPEQKSDTA